MYKRDIDIVLLLDLGAGMQPVMNALKDNIHVMVESILSLYPKSNWRIKVCGYGDSQSDGDNWWQESDFTSDIGKVRKYIGDLNIIGNTPPKSLLDALWKLSQIPESKIVDDGKWRYRIDKFTTRSVIIFTTSDSYMDTSISAADGATFNDVVREVMSSNLRLSLFCPETDFYLSFAETDKSETEIIGNLQDIQQKMKEFAIDTERFVDTMRDIVRSFPCFGCAD